jgi:hypothetical protein
MDSEAEASYRGCVEVVSNRIYNNGQPGKYFDARIRDTQPVATIKIPARSRTSRKSLPIHLADAIITVTMSRSKQPTNLLITRDSK